MNPAPQDATHDNPELAVIADFLRECLPFNELPPDDLTAVVTRLEVTYYCQGHVFTPEGSDSGLRIVRSGAAELWDGEDKLLDRLGEGESFNLTGLNLEHQQVRAQLIEDSLIYLLPEADYLALREAFPRIDRFFLNQRSRRLHGVMLQERDPGDMVRPVSTLMSTELLTVAPGDSIADVARAMHQWRVSSAIVLEDGALRGIVTDRDLRSRVLATGLSPDRPVAQIMTPEPRALETSATLFDATLFMTRHCHHHLPLLRDGVLAGLVTTTDLMLARNDDPVYLVKQVSRQRQLAGIKHIVASLPNLLVQWVEAGVRADQAAHILTAISDAVTVRLIQLYIEQAGPAPVPFCWLGFGSQAREEQLINADQDNGLLIDDALEDEQQGWFEGLARSVSDGLAASGYVYCPGKVMATTDDWRQTLSGWRRTVDKWTRSPTPNAVMRVSIFFDLRPVYGDAELCTQLQSHMLARASSNSIFLAALAANALGTPAPLGVFRRFVVERNGEHRDSLDLKKRGIIPIIDMIRIHALANSIPQVNTSERIAALVEGGAMAQIDGRNMLDALEFIMQLRIRSQARQIQAGEKTSNHINPRDLPKLAREQLRDAFTILHDAQTTARMRYRGGL